MLIIWAATGQSSGLSQSPSASGPPPSYQEKGTGTEFRQGSHRHGGKGRSETGEEAKVQRGLFERGTMQDRQGKGRGGGGSHRRDSAGYPGAAGRAAPSVVSTLFDSGHRRRFQLC